MRSPSYRFFHLPHLNRTFVVHLHSVINLFAAKGAVYSTKRHTIPPSNTSCDQSLLHLAFDQASLESSNTTSSDGTSGGGAGGDKSNGVRAGGLERRNVAALVSLLGVGSVLVL